MAAAACGRNPERVSAQTPMQQPPTDGQAAAPGAPAGVRAIAELAKNDWTMPAGDYGNLRYSQLNTITPANAKDLRVITTLSTGVNHGHEGQPLIVHNTMYVVTPYPNN